MNDFMNPHIVLSEMYTESLNENYIFCVNKVTFRLIINQNRLYCFAIWCLMLFLIHSHTHTLKREREKTAFTLNDI